MVIGWRAPEGCSKAAVNRIGSFQVVVDGRVQATVPYNNHDVDEEETSASATAAAVYRATVTGVDPATVHSISVKSVAPPSKEQQQQQSSSSRRRDCSEESACTMVFGRDAPLAPTAVRASRVTSTSCTVSWVPSNSNFLHSICVGRVEVKTVRPGVHRHTLAGLQPSTLYKVRNEL